VPAIRTEALRQRLIEFGLTEVDLLKLDCEGAECMILESLAENGRLTQVGWIRGEWHGRRNKQRLAKALAETHVYHIDSNPPHQCSRRALAITDTELKLMAAAAIIGLSSRPKNGYRMPAATGTPRVL
jgi:hypothetical protein